MRMQAVWNGKVLADSDRTVVIEGNHYFPPDAVNRELFVDSATHTACPWKGTAHYFTVAVGGESNPDAAWFYPEPKPEAEKIRDYVAFWHGVEVGPVEQA